MSKQISYDTWSREDLIKHIHHLETTLPSTSKPPTKLKPRKVPKPFSIESHPARKIALKFCYSGWLYNGLAFQSDHTPLPTVEGVLLNALCETKLISNGDENLGDNARLKQAMDACDWSRCGRTDRGVSAAGQVISLRVRSAVRAAATEEAPPADIDSALPETHAPSIPSEDPTEGQDVDPFLSLMDTENLATCGSVVSSLTAEHRPELNYIDILNRVLPPSIRILAWSPVASDFDARFSCTWRHYKYFFHSSHLNLERMQNGAKRLEGENDFRNMCKIDPSKQISNFRRHISRATITPVAETRTSDLYVLDVVGNGFLYHQIRHIMSVLLLVGSGLEDPSLISALLNTDPDNPIPSSSKEPLSVVETKPVYQMADALPLVLWDCGYPESIVQWRCDPPESEITAAAATDERDASAGSANLIYHMEAALQRVSIEETVQAHFIQAAKSYQGSAEPTRPPSQTTGGLPNNGPKSGYLPMYQIPLGGGTHRRTRTYTALLKRERGEPAGVVNARWLEKKVRRQIVDNQSDE